MDRVGPTIVGRRSTPGADAARDLLSRNAVPHPLAPLLDTASVGTDRLPLVLFPDGTQLEGPAEEYVELVSGRTEPVPRERYLASAHWRRVSRARGSADGAQQRALRRDRRRRAGRAYGRRLCALRGTSHAGVRAARTRRASRYDLPDRELPRLSRWHRRRRARSRHTRAGAPSRRRIPDRSRDRGGPSRVGRVDRRHAYQRQQVARPQRSDSHRGRLPSAERSGGRGVRGPGRALRLGHRRGPELRPWSRERGRWREFSRPGGPPPCHARAARDDPRVAARFWDDEEMPLLRSYWDACRAVVPAALASVSEQAQVGLADIGVLRDWWTGAGLREVALASSRYPPSTRASTISGSRSRPASVTQARSTSRSTVSSSGRYTPAHTVGSPPSEGA